MESNHSVFVDLPTPHSDDQGSIQMLIDFPVGSVLVITSKKGAIHANHYHKEDVHHCYLASGCIEYYCRPVGQTTAPIKGGD